MKTPTTEQFKKIIWDYYEQHERSFPWRHVDDHYKVFLSEIMLQQTQTSRVAEKYKRFINIFPTVDKLAEAPFSKVLELWQGLGYNRRARYLHEASQTIVERYCGEIPKSIEELQTLPGIGPATAGAIRAYAFNLPSVFVETNIRSVYIHFFFENANEINDSDILPLVDETLDVENPRSWYYALTDYGVFLKKQGINPNTKSKHYTKQSKFEGSHRQARARILKHILNNTPTNIKSVQSETNYPEEKIAQVIEELTNEDFIEINNSTVTIKDN